MSAEFQHPELGLINGVLDDGVIQFRGIQYATLDNRFASPRLKEEYNGSIDATNFGYMDCT